MDEDSIDDFSNGLLFALEELPERYAAENSFQARLARVISELRIKKRNLTYHPQNIRAMLKIKSGN